MTAEDLTNAYMSIRTEREKLSADYKAKDEKLKEDLEVVERELLKICSEQNVDLMRTKFGTVSRSIKTRVHVIDWDSFYDYIIEHKAPQLLTKRIHESNFEEFTSERKHEGLPPGVNVAREYTITVRKPSKKETALEEVDAV
jgi:hypothetical protein